MVRQFSAGGFVFKKDHRQILWLVRKPKANPGYHGNLGWTWPKGWIDKGESAQDTAIREVREEAGVEAKIIEKLDTIKIFFKDEGQLVLKHITYFLMEWQQDLPAGFDSETEAVQWVTSAQAQDMLAFENEKKLLAKASELVP